MQDSGIPAKFPIPWGNSAGGAYIRTIPQASQIGVQNGAASLTDGFPPNCFIPIAGGGSWPFAQDFNGVLKQITSWDQWVQAGGPITYDATFQTAIGGYPKGATVASATTFGNFWLCTVDNNTSNPDTGGAGWISAFAGRLLNVRYFYTLGTTTYTPTTGTNSVEVDVQGAGGAGGGAPATPAGNTSIGGNAGAGAYARKRILTGFAGVTITVGAGGAVVSGGVGGTGGSSSFGSIVSAAGGNGGSIIGPTTLSSYVVFPPGIIATPTLGDLNVGGALPSQIFCISGTSVGAPVAAALFGPSFGAGGIGSGQNAASTAAATGFAGKQGLVIVREYS